MEPRTYSNAPVGMNFLIVGDVETRGALSFDPAVPITDAKLRNTSPVVAYARVLDFGGLSGKFDAVLPYTWLSGTAKYLGDPIERVVDGPNDPAFRVSVNFIGAPALDLKRFRGYRQDLIVGASLRVSAPWGQYDADRLVNIGTNRWTFRPEVGISKSRGPWTLEATASATFYTDNDEFYGGTTRSQDPLYSLQGHAIYGFDSGAWLAVDAVYFAGARTTVGGKRNNDYQSNWRFGGTYAIPVDARNSIKIYASTGVASRTGSKYDLLGIAWQFRWGAGL